MSVAADELRVIDNGAVRPFLRQPVEPPDRLVLAHVPRARQRRRLPATNRNRVDRLVGVVGVDDLPEQQPPIRTVEMPRLELRPDNIDDALRLS